MTSSTSKSLRTSASVHADEAANAAGNALESTKQLAAQAIERAGERVRDLRYGVKGLANKSLHAASDAGVAAQRQFSHYADATGRYVSQQPVKSVVIAVAAGAAIAALIVAARRRNRNRY